MLTDPCGGSGAVLEADFPYEQWEVPCSCPYDHRYHIVDWAYINGPEGPTVEAIKQAIVEYGPVSVLVHVNGAFQGYGGGIFNGCEDGELNHAVALVGWDDSMGSEGVWILRNSWGSWWGDDGYMYIEYGCSEVGSGAAYVDYPGALSVTLPDGPPELVPPGVGVPITVRIEELNGEYVPGTARLHTRASGVGVWVADTLEPLGGDLYRAVLPAAACGDEPEFYITAQSDVGSVLAEPDDAPEETFRVRVGELVTVMADDFEVQQGWQIQSASGLTGGEWERGVPAGDGTYGDPTVDYDGSGPVLSDRERTG